MNEVRLILGVVGLNVICAAVGYSMLSMPLQSAKTRTWLTYMPVAILVGAGVMGVALEWLVLIGLRANISIFVALATCVVTASFALRWRLKPALHRWAAVPEISPRRPTEATAPVLATVCICVVTLLSVLVLLGGFRTAPWLDDSWSFWVPKGLFLGNLGLDPRMFTPNPTFVALTHRSYPVFWSILANLSIRFVGHIDLRSVTAELSVLTVAFVGALARLLTGLVRPALLWLALALFLLSPEVAHQTQAGGADLVLGLYLALFVLAAMGWIASRNPAAVVLSGLFGSVALATKVEALPEFVICAFVMCVTAWRAHRASWRPLALAAIAALVSTLPWFIWAQLYAGREPRADYGSSLGFVHGLTSTHRIAPAAHALFAQVTSPQHWLLIVPATVLLSLVVAARERRLVWCSPAVLLCLIFCFLVGIYWFDTRPLAASLATTSYRLVVPMTLVAITALPLLAERLASVIPHWDLALSGSFATGSLALFVVVIAAPVSQSQAQRVLIVGSPPLSPALIRGVDIRVWTFAAALPSGWSRLGGVRLLGPSALRQFAAPLSGRHHGHRVACLDAKTGVPRFGYQLLAPKHTLPAGSYQAVVSGRIDSGGLEVGVLDTLHDKWIETVNYTAASTGSRPVLMGETFTITRPAKVQLILTNMRPTGGSSIWAICDVSLRRV